MMGVLTVLVAFAAVVATQAHPSSQGFTKRLFTYRKDCLARTGVNESVVEQTHDGNFEEDPKLKEYFLCLTQKVGALNEAGEIQESVIRKNLAQYITDPAELDKLIQDCAIQKDSPLETAFYMLKCSEKLWRRVDFSFYVIPVTAEKRKIIKKYCRECIEETKVDMKLIEAARKGDFSEDTVFKQYMLCMSKKFGFQNADGSLQKNMIKEKLTVALKDVTKAEKLSNACVVEKELPEDTASALLKCFFQNTHVDYVDNPVKLSPEKAEKLMAYHKECINQTDVDMALVDATREGDFPEDIKLKEYFFCLSKKAEFQDEVGDIRKDVLRQKLNEIIEDPVVSQQLIEKCAVKKDTPQNTAFSTVKCYYENTPSHINIFQIVTVSSKQKQKLIAYNTECQAESGIESDDLNQLKKGLFPNNERFKNHLFCFYKKLGFQNDAGDIQKDVLSEKLGRLLRNAAVSERLVNRCAIQRESPQDTAYDAFTCYFENSPSHFNIFAIF